MNKMNFNDVTNDLMSVSEPQVKNIKVESIVESDENVRIDIKEIRELSESINDIGLLFPLVVHRTGKSTYELIDGHRRFKAIKALGWGEVECKAYDFKLNTSKVSEIMVTTDKTSLSWSKYDYARKAYAIYNIKNSMELTAKSLGIHKNEVRPYILVGSLSVGILTKAIKNNVPFNFSAVLADKVATKQLCKRLGMKRDEVVDAILDKYIAGKIKSTGEFNKCVPRIKETEPSDIKFWIEGNRGLETLKALVLNPSGELDSFKQRLAKNKEKMKTELLKLEDAEQLSINDMKEIGGAIKDLHDTTRRIYRKLCERERKSRQD